MNKRDIVKNADGSFQISDSQISKNLIEKMKKLIKSKTTVAQTNFDESNYKDPVFFEIDGGQAFGDIDAYRNYEKIISERKNAKYNEMLR